jgi:hypothetical protein
MKYYEILSIYRRSEYFWFDYEKNKIESFELLINKGTLNMDKVYFKVDKIDKYIDNYDILPSGCQILLISSKLKNLLERMAGDVCQFIPAIIVGTKGETNTNFFGLNILYFVDCFDRDKSEYTMIDNPNEIERIETMYFDYDKLGKHHICRLEVPAFKKIVSEVFVQECRKNKIKGIAFMKEGDLNDAEFFK